MISCPVAGRRASRQMARSPSGRTSATWAASMLLINSLSGAEAPGGRRSDRRNECSRLGAQVADEIAVTPRRSGVLPPTLHLHRRSSAATASSGNTTPSRGLLDAGPRREPAWRRSNGNRYLELSRPPRPVQQLAATKCDQVPQGPPKQIERPINREALSGVLNSHRRGALDDHRSPLPKLSEPPRIGGTEVHAAMADVAACPDRPPTTALCTKGTAVVDPDRVLHFELVTPAESTRNTVGGGIHHDLGELLQHVGAVLVSCCRPVGPSTPGNVFRASRCA